MMKSALPMLLLSLLSLLLLAPSTSDARTWLVRQDGSGDCTTIQACVTLAQARDSVLVFPGTYQEHIIVGAPILLVGESGSSATIIDGTNTGRCILLDEIASPGVVVKGFTIRNGELMDYPGTFETANGAGIFSRGSVGIVAECVLEYIAGMSIGCDETSNMTIENNLMQENYSTYVEPPYPVCGGGVITLSSNTFIQENTFINNMDEDVVIQACSPQVIRNRFLGTPYSGGIIGAGTAYIAENLFTNCHRAVSLWGNTEFTRNTVVNNRGTGVSVAAAYVPVISNNIITGNLTGISCSYGTPSMYCNDVWNNTKNYGCVEPSADSHLDPQFCDAAGGDFHLNCTSPCANYSGCGQVGAFGVACGSTAVEETTWGRVKSMFR
ncbi:MAG: right-handed parallel beta-helix repeat-containing protein [Candidatus Eisenbacteria bacterium]|nr:right-handed parallel beta-helix repeat-containing protein [Candidatus Eisenbacteria bacterium]